MTGKTGNELNILWGVQAISDEIGRPYDATLRMLRLGLLPASRIGLKWCSDKETLRRHFQEKFAASAAMAETGTGSSSDDAEPTSSADRA